MLIYFIFFLSSLDFVLPEEQPSTQPPSLQPQQPMVTKPSLQTPPSPTKRQTPHDYHYPFNVTISHLSPRSIEISWSCRDTAVNDRYEVTIKPVQASYKVVETVPNNMCFLLMDKLEPDTTYQVAVASISGRTRKRSGYVIFRTFMEDYYTELDDNDMSFSSVYDGSSSDTSSPSSTSSSSESSDNAKGRLRVPRVRLVEICLVAMALLLWSGAIVLFFHRWGKIRMLLPYQPDYKAMKNATSQCNNCSMTPHHQCQKIHHIQNTTTECCQAQVPQGPTAVTSGYHASTHPHNSPRHGHLPHQPMSEPGPGCSSGEGGGQTEMVCVADTGCSPIRHNRVEFIEGDIIVDMGLLDHQPSSFHRKARSMEQIKQFVYPWDEPNYMELTEF